MESITVKSSESEFMGNAIGACRVGLCNSFQAWQEELWASTAHSPNGIRERSEDKVAECMKVNGCVFEQTVEISGVENA